MGWDPTVLRKYNTTGHFRLLNQVRSELKGNPLIRPKEGETVATANRTRSLIRALEVRPQGGWGRSRRSAAVSTAAAAPASAVSPPPVPVSVPSAVAAQESAGNSSFRDRLSAIDMR